MRILVLFVLCAITANLIAAADKLVLSNYFTPDKSESNGEANFKNTCFGMKPKASLAITENPTIAKKFKLTFQGENNFNSYEDYVLSAWGSFRP